MNSSVKAPKKSSVAFSEDSIQAAKIAVSFAKNNEKLKIIGGSFEGKLVDREQVYFLASLPSLDELRAKLIGLFQAPAVKISNILTVPANQVARVINAYANKSN